MLSSTLLPLLALVVHTLGTPSPNSGSFQCSRDPLYLVFLNPLYNGPAVSFCRSYLHIPTATATVSAKITVKGSPSTVTITNTPAPSTVVITPTSTFTAPPTTTPTTTVYTTYTPDENFKQKRDSSQNVPSYCKGYVASQISSACSCLSIQPSTTTVTATGTVTIPGSIATQTISGSVAPVTITGTPTTTTVTGTTTATKLLPTLCDPVNLLNYTGTNDQRDSKQTFVSDNTIQDCCLACYNTQNCLTFMFTGGQCSYYVALGPVSFASNFAYRMDLCPYQVSAGSKMVGPGMGTQNYGPCLADSPLEANGCPEPGTIGADYPPGCPN